MNLPSYLDLNGDMNDVRPAQYPNFSLSSYLREQGLRFVERDSNDHIEFSLNCPKCEERGCDGPDTRQRLWVNPQMGVFHCYRCHWEGPLVRFIEHYSRASYKSALRILQGRAVNPLEHLSFSLHHGDVDDEEAELVLNEIEFPTGFTPFEKRDRNLFTEYLKYRGIPLEYAISHGWGYAEIGPFRNRIIVPSFVEGKLVLWQGRDVLDKHHPDWGTDAYRKVRNPSGVSASKVLYNYDNAKHSKVIAIGEGFIDAAKIGDFAVATNGKNLHDAQLELLAKTEAEIVVLVWDWDAYHDAMPRKRGKPTKPSSAERAEKKLSAYFEVKHFKTPKGRDAGSYKFGSVGKRILDSLSEL